MIFTLIIYIHSINIKKIPSRESLQFPLISTDSLKYLEFYFEKNGIYSHKNKIYYN